MKALYISLVDITNNNIGVVKKIRSQVKGFRDSGIIFDIVFLKEGTIYIEEYEKNYKIAENISTIDFYSYIKDNIPLKSYSFIYMRLPYPGKALLNLWKVLKVSDNFIIEIPTYPFLNESKNLKSKILNYILICQLYYFRESINLYTYMGAKRNEIFKNKCLRVYNCVDSDSLNIKSSLNTKKDKRLNFIGVAQLATWHGYDRLIRSIYEYKKNKYEYHIKFYIIGNNLEGCNEKEYLQKLVRELDLIDDVIFVPAKDSHQLNDYFNICDVAVDSLARHRSNNYYNCSLKSKEYCVRGVPFIKSHEDDSFNDCGFVYDCKPDESIIDLEGIIDWYLKLDDTATSIRNYGVNVFSWKKQLVEKVEAAIKCQK